MVGTLCSTRITAYDWFFNLSFFSFSATVFMIMDGRILTLFFKVSFMINLIIDCLYYIINLRMVV